MKKGLLIIDNGAFEALNNSFDEALQLIGEVLFK